MKDRGNPTPAEIASIHNQRIRNNVDKYDQVLRYGSHFDWAKPLSRLLSVTLGVRDSEPIHRNSRDPGDLQSRQGLGMRYGDIVSGSGTLQDTWTPLKPGKGNGCVDSIIRIAVPAPIIVGCVYLAVILTEGWKNSGNSPIDQQTIGIVDDYQPIGYSVSVGTESVEINPTSDQLPTSVPETLELRSCGSPAFLAEASGVVCTGSSTHYQDQCRDIYGNIGFESITLDSANQGLYINGSTSYRVQCP